MAGRPKVLLSAYACRPQGGSEPGAGWAWAKAAARDHDVWLLTRGKFAHEIADELAQRPIPSLTVVPLELPKWLLNLRRRHADVYWYYPLWQRLAGRTAARLHAEQKFDVIHHLTFATDWMPAGVVQPSTAKVIWGPVGGSTAVPLSMAHWLGGRGVAGELVRRVWTGFTRKVVGRRLAQSADLVVAQNKDVAEVFGRYAREITVQPNVAIRRFASASGPYEPYSHGVRTALFVGRLIPWKGVALAISALARPEADGWELRVVGDGPEWGRAERLAESLGVRDRVEFAGALPREQVLAAMLRADALLAPAMREAAGWAVTEALASGCPVVCLDRGGPSVIVGPDEGAVVGWRGDVVGELAKALRSLEGRITPVDRWGPDRLPDILAQWYGCTEVPR
ncbi:glycosyltransferase involved in cell wall biosynthesis [Kribbella amoyensis]|uniref:Glycosyltransferase involved in cell wall biosynthesis n=1 Tax=Kribbella amoyensis TaxID=996641 RepID=A0A561BWP8_9ACTN|nr:glycosyltransferase [Kribbella amoyensis]TWD83315.1 glycosyltransferase involved in cell wall biosynthesis [Kribbella amoyensis]